MVGTNQSGSGENFTLNKENMEQAEGGTHDRHPPCHRLREAEEHIEMTVTAEGLRIELLESQNGTVLRKRKRRADAEWHGS